MIRARTLAAASVRLGGSSATMMIGGVHSLGAALAAGPRGRVLRGEVRFDRADVLLVIGDGPERAAGRGSAAVSRPAGRRRTATVEVGPERRRRGSAATVPRAVRPGTRRCR